MGRLIPALGLAACTGIAPGPAAPPARPGPPTLESATLDCDEEAGRWTLTVRASAWTGGGTSAWTEDGDYVEIHAIPRVQWAEDGSSETLKLTLSIVEDWREVDSGRTVFTCARDPSGVMEITDLDGAPVGCRAWGPDPAIFDAIADTPRCDQPIDRI